MKYFIHKTSTEKYFFLNQVDNWSMSPRGAGWLFGAKVSFIRLKIHIFI